MAKLTAISSMVLLIMVEPVAALDPVALMNEGLMLAIMIIAIIFAIRYRQRLFFLLTGDDHVHASVLSTIWFVGCRCFGLCDGSWTKYVSWVLCCCCSSMRGLNLKRMLGQAIGIVPIPVRISNIVVGDIPAYNTSNFYLSVEVGENPIQITSIAEDASPKVVQFEETLIIRVRYAPVEFNVRFCVRELTVFGNKELCECYINPMAMVAWKFAERGPMRFRMEPVERSNDFTFPAWILMELQSHPEWSAPGDFAVRVTDTHSQTHHDLRNCADFKDQYKLVNSFGVKAEEPDERKLRKLSDAKVCQGLILKNILFLKIVILVVYFTSRMYIYNCQGTFKLKEVLRRADEKFPVTVSRRQWWSIRCSLTERTFFNMLGEIFLNIFGEGVEQAEQDIPGVKEGVAKAEKVPGTKDMLEGKNETARSPRKWDKNSTVPLAMWQCRPTRADVTHTCFHLPFGAQPPTFDISLGFTSVALPCEPQVCQLHPQCRIADAVVFVVLLVLLTKMFCVKAVFKVIIKKLHDDAHPQVN